MSRSSSPQPSGEPAARLSPAIEDYLKAIYKLQTRSEQETVAMGTLAEALEFSSASVTNMVKRLDELGLVDYEPYKGIRLTKTGMKVALEVLRHHRLLELYFREVMEYRWDLVHEEAEHLEHHISEEFEDKIDEMLGFPTHDPHGDPIPTRAGEIAEVDTMPLSDAPEGAPLIVRRVSDSDPDLLHYLEEIGLLPQASIRVTRSPPFKEPLVVQAEGKELTLGHYVASAVYVSIE